MKLKIGKWAEKSVVKLFMGNKDTFYTLQTDIFINVSTVLSTFTSNVSVYIYVLVGIKFTSIKLNSLAIHDFVHVNITIFSISMIDYTVW
jgi:hypothetical protein